MASPRAETVRAWVKDARLIGMVGDESNVQLFDLCFTERRLLLLGMGSSSGLNIPWWMFGGFWAYADLVGPFFAILFVLGAVAAVAQESGPSWAVGSLVAFIGIVPFSIFVASRIARRRSSSGRRTLKSRSPDELLTIGGRTLGVPYAKIVNVILREGNDPVEAEIGFYEDDIYVSRVFELRKSEVGPALASFNAFLPQKLTVERTNPVPV
jgi:hypothetical protein